jgi:hypothetical protein
MKKRRSIRAMKVWCEDALEGEDVARITDVDECLLIQPNSIDYPVLVYELTRADVGHNSKKAKKMRKHVAVPLPGMPWKVMQKLWVRFTKWGNKNGNYNCR